MSSFAVRFVLALLLPLAGLFAAAPAQSATLRFEAVLSGAAESPPVASSGTGKSVVFWDDVAMTLRVQVSFADLIGNTNVAHIHAATSLPGQGNAGVATMLPNFPGWPIGVNSGNYDATFDLLAPGTLNSFYISANGGTAGSAAAALLVALQDGKAYFNIHTNFAPGGEIRGFYTAVPSPVPLPATLPLLVLTLGWLGVAGRLRRGQKGR